MSQLRPVFIATRGSALALAQANYLLARCRAAHPSRAFELKVIKTTGDKLQTASLAHTGESLPKGLFTKELEVALLQREADLAVHSLKDLPTELPDGLRLAAVPIREDARDVLLYRLPGAGARGFAAGLRVQDLPSGAVLATSSTRRQAQLLAVQPGLRTVPIRGNVGTRLQKLRDQADLDGMVLALAGLKRLGFALSPDGTLTGPGVPSGLVGSILSLEEMLPCVGQAALGLEIRADDPDLNEICRSLDDQITHQAVIAERAFLRAMGGGCLSPVAAFAQPEHGQLRLQAVSFQHGAPRRSTRTAPLAEAAALGQAVARDLLPIGL